MQLAAVRLDPGAEGLLVQWPEFVGDGVHSVCDGKRAENSSPGPSQPRDDQIPWRLSVAGRQLDAKEIDHPGQGGVAIWIRHTKTGLDQVNDRARRGSTGRLSRSATTEPHPPHDCRLILARKKASA